MDTHLFEKLKNSLESGQLMASSFENLVNFLKLKQLPIWAELSIQELIEKDQWAEINNRFFKKAEFGTAGIRGRTIGAYVTHAEKGDRDGYAYAAIGCNCLNDFNVIQSTIGLFKYCQAFIEFNKEYPLRPRLVIAHDMRFFSRHFCELTASTWAKLGGDVYIFDGPRSTPQLSFSVRHLHAIAGVMITASHNPYYDNGYKAYFSDGAQISDKHTKVIIAKIDQINLQDVLKYLDKDLSQVFHLSPLMDEAYLECAQEVLLDANLLKNYKPKIVFTPLHGTGSVAIPPLFDIYEIDYYCVPEQMEMDSHFSTVKSPNPENKEALDMALKYAQEINADAVVATDPDGDRMAVAMKDAYQRWQILKGNTLAVLLAEYRLSTMIQQGWLTRKVENRQNVAIIKSIVTTPMLKAMADSYGIKLIDTLTGFKWIGAKLLDYEEEVILKIRKSQGMVLDYDKTTVKKRKDLLMRYSTFCAFAAEESYGYLANDRVRDKDANSSALMFAEFLAFMKSKEYNFSDYLDELYCKYGYFKEDQLSFTFEGADGFTKIQNLLNSYRTNPPKRLSNARVLTMVNYNEGVHKDADDKVIPATNLLIIRLLNGFSIAIRGSGTEPKVKMYLFGQCEVEHEDVLPQIKKDTQAFLESLKDALREDVAARVS